MGFELKMNVIDSQVATNPVEIVSMIAQNEIRTTSNKIDLSKFVTNEPVSLKES